jgi:hypothetical protein
MDDGGGWMKNALVILLAVFPLGAQQASAPPAVLHIFREDIKEGKGAAHEKSEAAFMQAAATANYPFHILGLSAMTGTSQAWFLVGHASFATIPEAEAALDKPEFAELDAADAQLRTGSLSMIARYRPDLSYAADKINLPKMRFFSVETVRVRPGQWDEYAELVKMLIAAQQKISDSQPVATYQVMSGAPNGTYLVMEATESLKSMDQGPQRLQAMFQAMGESGVKRYEKGVSEAIAGEESILFAVNPQMSYVPKEWITADPDFWTPKPVTVTKAPAKAPAKARKKTASK